MTLFIVPCARRHHAKRTIQRTRRQSARSRHCASADHRRRILRTLMAMQSSGRMISTGLMQPLIHRDVVIDQRAERDTGPPARRTAACGALKLFAPCLLVPVKSTTAEAVFRSIGDGHAHLLAIVHRTASCRRSAHQSRGAPRSSALKSRHAPYRPAPSPAHIVRPSLGAAPARLFHLLPVAPVRSAIFCSGLRAGWSAAFKISNISRLAVHPTIDQLEIVDQHTFLVDEVNRCGLIRVSCRFDIGMMPRQATKNRIVPSSNTGATYGDIGQMCAAIVGVV